MAVKANKEDILEAIAQLNVMELVGLVEAMEDKFGVSAAAPAAVAAPATAAAADGAAAADEKSEVELMLTASGDKKVNVIKVVRAITGLGLKESKDMVDSAPSSIKQAMPKEEAEEAKKKLEEAGASAELK